MVFYTNDCVDCNLPCVYDGCMYYNVKHFKCDECGNEDVKLYYYDDCELCEECLLKRFTVVDGSDDWY